MIGRRRLQTPAPKPPSPAGRNHDETQPGLADINLLPTKMGLDYGVHLQVRFWLNVVAYNLGNPARRDGGWCYPGGSTVGR